MVWYLETALSNAATVTLLAVLVWGIAAYFRRPALTHCLWVLLLVKLLTPPIINVNLPWAPSLLNTSPAVVEAPISPVAAPVVESLPASPQEFQGISHESLQVGGFQQMSDRQLSVARVASSATFVSPVFRWLGQRSWAFWLVILWGTGTLIFAWRTVVKLLRFQRLVRQFGFSSEDLQQQTTELTRSLGLAHAPRAYFIEGTLSPMIWGSGMNLCLLFPKDLWDSMPAESRRTLLLHELAHYHRGDHWVRLLETICLCMYWWHPVVWWAMREIEQSKEECCDAFVVNRENSRTYADAIITTLDFLADRDFANPPLASGMSEVPTLKRRLTQIMRRSVAERLSLLGRAAVLGWCSVALPLHPMLFAAPAVNQPVVEVEPVVLEQPRTIPAPETTTEPKPTLVQTIREDLPPTPKGWWNATPHERWATLTSPNGRTRLIAETGRRVSLEVLDAGQTYDLSAADVATAVYLPNGERFITGSHSGAIRLWEAATGEGTSNVGQHQSPITSIALDPTGKYVVSGSQDGSVVVWEVNSGAVLGTWTDSSFPVSAVRFTPDGERLVVLGTDFTRGDITRASVIDANNFEVIDAVELPINAGSVQPLDDDRFELADWNGIIYEWDLANESLAVSRQVARSTVTSAAFSPDLHF